MATINDQSLFGRNYHHPSMGPGATVLHAMGQIDTNIAAQQQQHHASDDLLDIPLLGHATYNSQSQRFIRNDVDEPSTTVINATNATVAITTTSSLAPNIAGLGKITPTTRTPNKPTRRVIRVPTYSCNGGLDTKFNSSPRHASPTHLHNLLSPEEYTIAIDTLNDSIKRCRANVIDKTLLVTGPLLVPLALWGVRHGQQVKKKKIEIQRAVEDFNERMLMEGRNVKMFWNRARMGDGGESFLTIEETDGSGKTGKLD